MAFDGVQAETLQISGHNGDKVDAYCARPVVAGPVPGVVVIHHFPGWDEWTREVCNKFALHGYAAIATHLYSRMSPGTTEDLSTRARAEGGMPDAQVMGDVRGAMNFLRAQSNANGKVGCIGFCSGGRHTYLAACQIPELNAAVDCWGGGVTVPDASQLTERQPVEPVTLTPQMQVPLLGIFGNDDARPSPADVDKTEEVLKQNGKNYEFHRYDGAGHGFLAVDRPSYRPEQAVDAWGKIFAFYEKYLSPVPAAAAAR